MSFQTETLDEIHERMLAHLRGRQPEANLAPLSPFWMSLRAVAMVIWGEQRGVNASKKQILLTTADPDFVPPHVAERLGEENAALPAKRASGKVAATSATAAALIATGALLTHASGKKFRVVAGTITHDPGFSGLTVLYGSSAARVLVAPDAFTIDPDDLVSITSVDIVRAVRATLPESGTPYALDFYQALDEAPAVGDAIEPVIGAVVDVEAVEAGDDGNLLPGDTLTWDSAGALEPIATVLEMTGGSDAEKTEGTRRRGLAFIRERPASGNRSDQRQWATETLGARLDDACVFLQYRGIGTMDVVPIGVSGARVVGSSVVDKVTAYIATKKSDFDDVRVRAMIDESPGADVHLELTIMPDYDPDWTGSYTIDAASTTSVVKLTSSPDLIEIDDRVLVMVQAGPLPGLYQRKVAAKDASGITLDEELPAAPTAGDFVDPGGPVTGDVIDGVNAFFDLLGPGDPGGFARFPGIAEAWEWRVLPERLEAIALAVTGVEGCDAITPSSILSPAQFARLVIATFRITHA